MNLPVAVVIDDMKLESTPWRWGDGAYTHLMEGILDINVSIYALVLNSVELASNQGYWIVSLVDELVPLDADVWYYSLYSGLGEPMLLQTGLSDGNRR